MIRWIRDHPYTSALPFMFFGFAAVIRVLSGRSLLESVGWASAFWGWACCSALLRARARRRRSDTVLAELTERVAKGEMSVNDARAEMGLKPWVGRCD